jgi:hypothetical protein
MALAAQVLAVVGLGVARAAIDEMVEIAGGRTSITGAPVLADRAYVQTEIAKAEAALRSARAFFFETTEQAFARLAAGDDLEREHVNLLRLASSHAARVGADVTRAIYTVSGHHRHLHRAPDRPLRAGRDDRAAARLPVGGHVAERGPGAAGPRFPSGLSLNSTLIGGRRGDCTPDQAPHPVLLCRHAELLRPAGRSDRAVWQATGAMLKGIRDLPGVEVLGTMDDDQTMVGTSPNGWPWTFYILADVADRQTAVEACNLFRTTPVGEHRLWKYMRVEARIGAN